MVDGQARGNYPHIAPEAKFSPNVNMDAIKITLESDKSSFAFGLSSWDTPGFDPSEFSKIAGEMVANWVLTKSAIREFEEKKEDGNE